MNTRIRTLTGRSAAALSGLAVAALLLAGCAGAGASEPAADDTAATQDAAPQAQAPRGVSGLIAAAQDGQLQVQAQDSQTTVRYTADTTVRTTVTVEVGDLTVGDCILAIGGTDDAATTITVTEQVDGECSAGPGGGFPGGAGGGMPSDRPDGGERPEGAPTDLPSGAPTDLPTGAPGGGFGGFTAGTVTAVAADSITVDTTDADGNTEAATVLVDADTTVSTTADGTSDDIAVGLCVTAQGEADDAGGYDATSLTLAQPGDDGECSSMGGFRGGFGTPPAQGGDDD